MSEKNELDELLARPSEITIMGQKVMVHGLDGNDLPEVTKTSSSNMDIKGQALKELVLRSLRKSFPDVPDETLLNLKIGFITEFLEAVFDVSGLKVDQKKLSEMTATFSG